MTSYLLFHKKQPTSNIADYTREIKKARETRDRGKRGKNADVLIAVKFNDT